MVNIEIVEYLKSEFKKINNLFLKGKFNLVIVKSKKIIKKYPKQIPFYNLLALSYREKSQLFLYSYCHQQLLKLD